MFGVDGVGGWWWWWWWWWCGDYGRSKLRKDGAMGRRSDVAIYSR